MFTVLGLLVSASLAMGQDTHTLYEINTGLVLEGTFVRVEDVIVTGVAYNGFYIQEQAGGEYSGAWFGGPMRINQETPPYALSPLVVHELGHVFGALDQPGCPNGITIMCSSNAYYWPNPVSDATRELIGWGEFPVHRVYLPQVR